MKKTVFYSYSAKTGVYQVVGVKNEENKDWKVVPSIKSKNFPQFTRLVEEYFVKETIKLKLIKKRKKK